MYIKKFCKLFSVPNSGIPSVNQLFSFIQILKLRDLLLNRHANLGELNFGDRTVTEVWFFFSCEAHPHQLGNNFSLPLRILHV